MTPPTTTHPETPEPQSTAPGRSVGADEGLREALAQHFFNETNGVGLWSSQSDAERAPWLAYAARVLAGPLATLTADRDRLARDLAAANTAYDELREAKDRADLRAMSNFHRANDATARAETAEGAQAAANARIAILLRVIDAGKAETALAFADEADSSATATTRRIRLENIDCALAGVGDIEARKALGLLNETIDAEPNRAALTQGGDHGEP